MNANQCWDWKDWDQDEDQEAGIGWTGTNWEQTKQVGNWDGYQPKKKLGLGLNECEDAKGLAYRGLEQLGRLSNE